jgi:hypothetical protein
MILYLALVSASSVFVARAGSYPMWTFTVAGVVNIRDELGILELNPVLTYSLAGFMRSKARRRSCRVGCPSFFDAYSCVIQIPRYTCGE